MLVAVKLVADVAGLQGQRQETRLKPQPAVRILFASNFPRLDSKMSFPPTTDELLEAFEDIQEWDERYDYIIDLGRELSELPAALQTKENICLLYTSPSPRDRG